MLVRPIEVRLALSVHGTLEAFHKDFAKKPKYDILGDPNPLINNFLFLCIHH